jgi:hypothetical protein
MKTKRKETEGKKSKNKSLYTSFPFIALSIIILLALLFFVWHQKSLEKATQQQEIFSQDLTEDIAVPEPVVSDTPKPLGSQNTTQFAGQAEEKSSTSDINDSKMTGQSNNENSLIGNTQNNPGLLAKSQSLEEDSTAHLQPTPSSEKENKTFQSIQCRNTTEYIEEFFKHLDKQPYLAKYEIEPDSKTYFFTLLQRTLDNPPVVSGETDDLYTILQNTAHFFRIIGNTNIAILKNVLSNEKAQFETIAAQFYSLLTSQACAEQNFGLTISKPALYEYAGFFLNTMGGRLYLFRRDSISRMVISYYSILLIDKANIQSFNKHGIELSTAIDLLISEMESTTNTLQLKDTYLNTLYALQEQYQ